MLRLTKKVEYALLALHYMAQRHGEVVTSRAVAEAYGLSAELAAKVLTSLAHHGIVRPLHGVRGGFVLEKSPRDISLAEVIRAAEGQQFHLVQCGEAECYVEPRCTIRSPLQALEAQIGRIFESVSVADLLDQPLVQLEVPHGD